MSIFSPQTFQNCFIYFKHFCLSLVINYYSTCISSITSESEHFLLYFLTYIYCYLNYPFMVSNNYLLWSLGGKHLKENILV